MIKFTFDKFRGLIKVDYTGGALTLRYATALVSDHHYDVILLKYLVNKLSVFTWFVLLVQLSIRVPAYGYAHVKFLIFRN